MAIGGYYIMVIGGYSMNGCYWLFYWWLLISILLMAIGGYSINDFGGYSINGHWWLFY